MLRRFLIFSFLYLAGCAAPVTLPKVSPLTENQSTATIQDTLKQARAASLEMRESESDQQINRLQQTLRAVRSGVGPSINEAPLPTNPPAYQFASIPYIPPPLKQARVQSSGEQHLFGFLIDPQWAEATRYRLAGEWEKGLQRLDEIAQRTDLPATQRWRLLHQRVVILIAMGRYGDAEESVPALEKIEIDLVGTNLSSRALRAELMMWAGDHKQAQKDAAQVVTAIGTWHLPTSYGGPPSNMIPLVNLTEAQLRALTIMGASLVLQDRFVEALPWLEIAEKLANETFYVFSHSLYGMFIKPFPEAFYGRANTLALLATARMAQGASMQEVAPLYERAKAYFGAIGYGPGDLLVETLKARGLLLTKAYDAANKQAQHVVVQAQEKGLMDLIWRVEALRGWALWHQGETEQAEAAARRAQSVVEEISGTLRRDEDKVRFGEGKEEITRLLVAINKKRADWGRLFADLERARARSFVDLLGQQSVAAHPSSKKLVSKIRELDGEIRQIRRQKAALLNTRIKPSGKGDLTDLLNRRKQLIATLAKQDANLASAFQVNSLPLKQIQNRLMDRTMLYFLPAQRGDPLEALWIRADRVELKRFSIEADRLRQIFALFNAARLDDEDGFDEVADALGIDEVEDDGEIREKYATSMLQQAFQPDQWQVGDGLFVVASGVTHFLPWGTLDLTYPVAVLPTGGWLARTVEGDTGIRPVLSAIIGDPNFGGLLSQLPGARKEATRLAQLYNTSALIGGEATEQQLRSALQNGKGGGILHLATHALFDGRDPLQSALILSRNERAYPLTAADLYSRPLKAKMVVLSACETGMGRISAGDDLLGLTRSFYLGGTERLLSTLWTVEDEATARFMEQFHVSLQQGSSAGWAWLAARDRVKSDGYPPSSYGAFILGGSL